MEQKEEGMNSKFLELLRKYKRKIEDEVENVCNDLIGLLDMYLIPGSKSSDSEVFYLKMKGDYYRYLAECSTGERSKKAAENANEAYKKASEKAEMLSPPNPIKLGLALNYSVFHYEIMNSPEKACKMARASFDAATTDITALEDEKNKESASILQLIKENLDLWSADVVGEANEEENEKM